MASKIFLMGFPGFIARRLVDQLLRKDPEASFVFLVEARLERTAAQALHELQVRHSSLGGRAKIVTGDITKPLMGLSQDTYNMLAAGTTHVWHLAAIYDLAVPPALAYRVNVVGTANVLDFCSACRNLKRLDYVSTCYVSGDRRGLVLERELDEGQGFKNHYESTKCWAEIEVRRRMDRIPTCIHRPAIVIGDSKTGETDKYDGPYFLVAALLKVPTFVPLINIGEGRSTLNLVPIDFLVAAMAELWPLEEALGKTVHLADPYPHASREVFGGIIQAMGFRKPAIDVPPPLLEACLSVDALQRFLRIPKELVIYANHEAVYDTTNQRQLLERTGVACPDLLSYLPVLVDYVKRNPKKRFLDDREARR
jgi:thioester reductase-like protein